MYCKDSKWRRDYDQVTFTFCGYMFRPRGVYDKVRKQAYTGFLPAVAPGKLTDVSRKIAVISVGVAGQTLTICWRRSALGISAARRS